MKAVTYYFLLLFAAFSFFNCSEEDNLEEDTLIGKWNLVEYNVGIAVDLNNDGVESFNLLEEIECPYAASLEFDNFGNRMSIIEYELFLKAQLSQQSNKIVFDTECSEGIIGLASELTQDERDSYIIDGNTLKINSLDAIEVFNEDFSEVINYLSVTKTYRKQ